MRGPKPRIALLASACVALVLASLARAETIQQGELRIQFDGKLSPHTLPRHGSAPVRVSVTANFASTKGGTPPQLRTIALAINRFGRFDRAGIPTCTLGDIQPATTENALAACGDALVGEGQFKAKILLTQQAPFPAAGKLYAFNGSVDGRPAILAHVYGTDPVPTSFTLVFLLLKGRGSFGTTLRASLPEVTGDSGYITAISMDLGRVFRAHGRTHSYLSASCPAPKGFPGASFPFAKARFGFKGRTLVSTLTRSCRARG